MVKKSKNKNSPKISKSTPAGAFEEESMESPEGHVDQNISNPEGSININLGGGTSSANIETLRGLQGEIVEMMSNPEGSNSQNIEEMEAYSQVPNSPPRSITTISTDSATYPEGSVDLNSKDRERSANPMSGFGEALNECEGEPRASDAWPDFPKSMADFVTKGKLSVVYFVSQCQGDYVIACRKAPEQQPRWPYFIYIPDSLVSGSLDFQRRLEVADLVAVSMFNWSEKFRDLAASRAEVTPAKKFWLNEATQLLPRQADATKITNIIYDDQPRENVTGVIYWVRFRAQHDPETFQYAELACCGLAHSARINRRQLNEIACHELTQGMLVSVSCIKVPRDSLISRTYVLPSNSPFRAGTEVMEVYPAIYGAIGHVSPHLMEWPNTNAMALPKCSHALRSSLTNI